MVRIAILVATLSVLVGCTGDCSSLEGGTSNLSRLAEIRPLQIEIEAKFVSVTDTFFETIGVSWQGLDTHGVAPLGGSGAHGSTVVVPTNLVGGQSNRDSVFFPNLNESRLVPVLNGSAAFATAPPGCFFFEPNELNLPSQVQRLYDVTFPNSATTANPAGLQFGFSVLDDNQTSVLLQAIQQDQNNRVLTAP